MQPVDREGCFLSANTSQVQPSTIPSNVVGNETIEFTAAERSG